MVVVVLPLPVIASGTSMGGQLDPLMISVRRCAAASCGRHPRRYYDQVAGQEGRLAMAFQFPDDIVSPVLPMARQGGFAPHVGNGHPRPSRPEAGTGDAVLASRRQGSFCCC
jgi:hypothetical protein